MQHVDIRQIFSQVFTLIFAQDAHGQANQGPQVNIVPAAFVMFAQIVDLGMAVMAGGNAVRCTGSQYLLGL